MTPESKNESENKNESNLVSQEIMESSGMHFRPSKHAHWRVRDTAREMAHVLYDHMMENNHWYRVWRQRNPGKNEKQLEEAFVERNLSLMLPQARAVMAQMLRDTSDENMKTELYDALLLDATLVRGRTQ